MGRTTSRAANPGACARAFTLIEVLIAVLILALGLLGLGAVFPVVIREQRIGQERLQGALTLNSARATLAAMDFDRDLERRLGTGVPSNGFFNELSRQRSFSQRQNLNNTNARNFGGWTVAAINPATSGATLTLLAPSPTLVVEVPLSARLAPAADARLGRPQFVWDFAVQRVSRLDNAGFSPTDFPPGAMRAAVFVRNIDPRIRVGDSSLMAQLLLGASVPVGETPPPNLSRTPTLDGTGVYSDLRTMWVQFLEFNGQRFRDRLYVDVRSMTLDQRVVLWESARRQGQRLVDNLGNIYTVIGSVGPDDAEAQPAAFLVVEPPIPDTVRAAQAGTVAVSQGGPAFQPNEVIRQVVFAPLPPVAVGLVELRP
jgi:prepilin-type N-terminal cleavage/methylation domain-containing protein